MTTTAKDSHRISAIVPTIGRPDSLRRLLESLSVQTCKIDEVIIADGSDNDETRVVVEAPKWRTSGVPVRRVAVRPPNTVRQRQAAIAAATGELLLLLDDDVILESACVEKLKSLLLQDKGIVGAFADFNNQSWSMPTHAWRFYLRHILRMKDGAWQGKVVGPLLRFGYDPRPTEAMPMEWLGTGNTMIRRAAYDAAGGFSNFFLHRCTLNEDVDLGIKLAKIGRILFCPSARMGHFHAAGGRVSPINAAEDDLYNRYLIMCRTQGRSVLSALGQILL